MDCAQCGKELMGRHNVKFCSRSCSATFNNKCRETHSAESRAKISAALKRWHAENVHPRAGVCDIKPILCGHCGGSFIPDRSGRKYCSNHCRILGRGLKERDQISFRTFQKMFARAFPDWHCPFCEWGETVEIHHIIERSKGGSDDLENLVALCPNHHSLVRKGKIDADVLRQFSIGVTYNHEEFMGRFYFGSNKNLDVQRVGRSEKVSKNKPS